MHTMNKSRLHTTPSRQDKSSLMQNPRPLLQRDPTSISDHLCPTPPTTPIHHPPPPSPTHHPPSSLSHPRPARCEACSHSMPSTVAPESLLGINTD